MLRLGSQLEQALAKIQHLEDNLSELGTKNRERFENLNQQRKPNTSAPDLSPQYSASTILRSKNVSQINRSELSNEDQVDLIKVNFDSLKHRTRALFT
jgi:hypothetical protein